MLNVVGCLDNLAWIWVYEKDVTSKNGTELDPKSVGLWRTQVRNSLSRKFQDHLDKREPWFASIKGFRDSSHTEFLFTLPLTLCAHQSSMITTVWVFHYQLLADYVTIDELGSILSRKWRANDRAKGFHFIFARF